MLESLRLVDRSGPLEEPDENLSLFGIELVTTTAAPQARIAEIGIYGPDLVPGWDPSGAAPGYYIVTEGQSARPLPLPLGENVADSVVVEPREDGTAAMLYFLDSWSPDPSLADKLYSVDLVTPGAEPQVLAQLPARVSEAYYDQCLDVFYGILVNHTAVRIGWDGVVVPTEVMFD